MLYHVVTIYNSRNYKGLVAMIDKGIKAILSTIVEIIKGL